MAGNLGDYETNNLIEEIKRFLENRSIAELMEVVRVATCQERKTRSWKHLKKECAK